MLQPRPFPETRPTLLARLRADGGPQQSPWREFFERYAPAVFRVARIQGLDANDADDIVQQVMVQIARHISSFHYDTDRGHFRQWVRRIAENKITDLRRRWRTSANQSTASVEHAEPVDGRPSLEELWAREWQVQDMLYCLDQVAVDFSPRRMEAFRMYVLEGVTAAETASTLGMTVGHVYVIRAQVINKVRQRMGELEAEGLPS